MGAADRRRPLTDSQDSLKFLADQTGGLPIENTNDLNLGSSGSWTISGLLPARIPGAGRRLAERLEPGPHQGQSQAPWAQGQGTPGVLRSLRHQRTQGRAADPLVMSALSPFGSGSITVRLTSLFAYDAAAAKEGSYVRSLLFINPADLHFDVDRQANTRHAFKSC